MVGPGNRKARKILVFARCLLFFLCYLLPLSCRRWAVASGLAVAPATEPGTVLTAALPWYLAPELPSLLTLMAAVLTAAPPAAAVACRRAYRCTTVAPAAVLTAAPSAATPANAEPAAVLTAVASAAMLTAEHAAVGPTAPSGGKRSGRRRPPPVYPGVSLLGLWPLGQGL